MNKIISVPKGEKMKLLKHSLIAAAFVAATSTSGMAADLKGLSISVDPMYMAVFGDDVHAGDVYTYDYSGASGYYYQYSGNPIIAKPDGKLTLRGEVEYKKGEWGLGVNYWGLSSDGSQIGSITDPVSGDSSYVGIRLGDNSWSSDNQATTINWSTSNKIKVWTSDVYGIKTIMDDQDKTFNLTFGLKFAKLQNQRVDHMSYDDANFNTYTYDWNKKADSDLLIGPMLGIQGHFHWEKQRVIGTVTQSFVYGDVNYQSMTAREYVYESGGGYSYLYDTSHKTTEVIPVTEVKLKWMYDFTPNVSLGLGVFASMWTNAPMAQEADMYYTNAESKKTVIFAGSMGSLEYRF